MSESIESELDSRLKNAMRERDEPSLVVIRAIRGKVTEARTAKGYSGEVDDALYLKVIAAYSKSMAKAVGEYERVGESTGSRVEQLRFEVNYLAEFLPKKLGEHKTRILVEQAVARTGATAKAELGRIMGVIMKDHSDEVDATLVRSIAESMLSD
jgi:uncharacterized protein YqeY